MNNEQKKVYPQYTIPDEVAELKREIEQRVKYYPEWGLSEEDADLYIGKMVSASRRITAVDHLVRSLSPSQMNLLNAFIGVLSDRQQKVAHFLFYGPTPDIPSVSLTPKK